MQKASPAAGARNQKTVLREKATPQTVIDLSAVRQQIVNLVANDAVQMVAATIEQVNNGHYQALKSLFEMIGLFPATIPPETLEDDSLAKTLLARLDILEEADLSSPHPHYTSDSAKLGTHVVK